MKKVQFFLIFFFIAFNICKLYAQNEDLPVKKYKSKSTQPYLSARDYVNWMHYSFSFGYIQTSFLNEQFALNKEAGNVKNKFGAILNFRFDKYLPLILDLGWFSSRFRVGEDTPGWTVPDSLKVKHRGLELTASFAILPVSKNFVPYIGTGIQTASLMVGPKFIQSGETNDITEHKSSVNITAPIWKTGVMVNFNEFFYMHTEYKQTFSINDVKAFNQFMFGLGIRL